jgi:extradiol dioxygenase family protein
MRPCPFHYSFHVRDLDSTRLFYGRLLGCREGRSTASWVDFDFFGNQISAHLGQAVRTADTGEVDGVAVPMPHFGAIIGWDELHEIARRASEAGHPPLLGPLVRYPGQPAEQATVFLRDPSGNALELKAFRDARHVFTP